MSDVATRFHENWLGLVQPIEGLVVSVPVLVDAECLERQPPSVQDRLVELCPPDAEGRPVLRDAWGVLQEVLGISRAAFDEGEALPEALMLYVAEGGQVLRPTAGLRRAEDEEGAGVGGGAGAGGAALDDSTPASRAGAAYSMLLWVLPPGVGLDRPEAVTGPWEYPPSAKFDRLLRECRVPIGVVCSEHELRLVYAPHGESTGAMTFRLGDMTQVGGRPILDAFVMLLSEFRWFGAAVERRLPAILRASRARQADVTNALAEQLLEALGVLLQGFEAAAERDGDALLREALAQEDDSLYSGLLTLLLRLVFVLYAEDRGLMPVEHPVYGEHLAVLSLYGELQADDGAYPDTMGRRFGAYARLVALFRAVFFGVRHEELYMPPRAGVLFDPGRFPFLEGSGPGGGAPVDPRARADVRVPSVSDEVVYRVLDKLLMLGGQRLSYRALEVEQIGSVYEALMGYHVQRVGSASVCLRPMRVWVGVEEVRRVKGAARAKWLAEQAGLAKAQAQRLREALDEAKGEEELLGALERFAVKGSGRVRAGQLVIQPGEERRRTSSHYTPRSLSEPIVRRTLEPLIAAMDEKGEPASERLLRLKVCDPAMGSGAFLVAACRFLADQVVAAWTREGVLGEVVAGHEDPVMHARRLVAQKCLYGVDKNPFAVNLAKLSVWLETLAKGEPFTFLDHALKCGDSLLGLSIGQIKRFEWTADVSGGAGEEEAGQCGKKGKGKSGKKKAAEGGGQQLGLFDGAIERALLAAYQARRRLLALAEAKGDHAALGEEKARLHEEAEVALERARVIGDVLVGAFFKEGKEKARVEEAKRRKDVVTGWLMGGSEAVMPSEVAAWVAEIRSGQRPFHWGVEFPEVFWEGREDPLEGDRVNQGAWVDAFVGNPPFMGGKRLRSHFGDEMGLWLEYLHGTSKNSDLAAHFFRRAKFLLGNHGTFGLLAPSAIAEGDTRAAALQPLVHNGGLIYNAVSMALWPGDAKVAYSVVHVAIGSAKRGVNVITLDGRRVTAINSRLRPRPERHDPVVLQENGGKSLNGCFLRGQGFVLTIEEATVLERNESNRSYIKPYIGGEDITSLPKIEPERKIIDLGVLPESVLDEVPDLAKILIERVKPERDRLGNTPDDKVHKQYWWRFGRPRPELRQALGRLHRCLVTSQVSKHLVIAVQSPETVFAHTLCVFPLEEWSYFVCLQSRAHEYWARLLSSSFGSWPWPVLRYAPSDCFETFPFPRTLTPLDPIGERLYTTRAAYMVDTDQGLTKTYNALKDPENTDPRIVELRELHLEMDRAVLAAYGWGDIPVPPFTDPVTEEDKAARQAFEDEVLDRLFALNAERAAEERRVGGKKA